MACFASALERRVKKKEKKTDNNLFGHDIEYTTIFVLSFYPQYNECVVTCGVSGQWKEIFLDQGNT